VATAFAGFTGIVVALASRARTDWSSNHINAIAALLASSLGVVFFAFVPDLVRAARLETDQAWRISTCLFAAYHVVVIVTAYRARARALSSGETDLIPRRAALLLPVGGFSIIVAQFLTGAGFLQPWLFFFYLLGLLWMLAIATFVFAVLLMDTMLSRPPA
jgi:hypothetical protein